MDGAGDDEVLWVWSQQYYPVLIARSVSSSWERIFLAAMNLCQWYDHTVIKCTNMQRRPSAHGAPALPDARASAPATGARF